MVAKRIRGLLLQQGNKQMVSRIVSGWVDCAHQSLTESTRLAVASSHSLAVSVSQCQLLFGEYSVVTTMKQFRQDVPYNATPIIHEDGGNKWPMQEQGMCCETCDLCTL